MLLYNYSQNIQHSQILKSAPKYASFSIETQQGLYIAFCFTNYICIFHMRENSRVTAEVEYLSSLDSPVELKQVRLNIT